MLNGSGKKSRDAENIKFETIRKISETNFKIKNLNSYGSGMGKGIYNLDSNSPPSVFIGSKLKYPNANVGILSPLEKDENAWVYDDNRYWAKNNFGISDVVKLRQGLLNSRFKTSVKDIRNTSFNNSSSKSKFLNIAREIVLSANKPVDVELGFKKGLNPKTSGEMSSNDGITTPRGMKALLDRARITSNISVPRKIDKFFNDDVKSSSALKELYKSGYDENVLSKVLSVGALGMSKNRKLVPTRWSITATDDSLGKDIISEIRDYKSIEDYELFFGEFMGNQYLILLIPEIWSYELFELYLPGSSWNPSDSESNGEIKASTDLEWFAGRSSYAENTSGGYYAARLPILEYLKNKKRQASVLAIRYETASYWAALGVWVVRESVRKAISENNSSLNSKGGGKKPVRFSDRKEALESLKQISKIKFNFDPSKILEKSKLLEVAGKQKKLGEWF